MAEVLDPNETYALMDSGTYHRKDCGYAKAADTFVTLAELPANAEPCGRCKPPLRGSGSDAAASIVGGVLPPDPRNAPDTVQESPRDRAIREAAEALEIAKQKAAAAQAVRGRRIATIALRKCFYNGVLYNVGSKGPTFFGRITSKNFSEAGE